MKTIGICGHRGAGKKTVASIIGVIMEGLFGDQYDDIFNRTERYREFCRQFCEKICQNEEALNEMFDFPYPHTKFQAFKDSPLALIQMLTGIPFEDLNSDQKKDSMYVNIDTFEYKEFKDLPKVYSIFNAEEAYQMLKDLPVGKLRSQIWMTLREFIIYFGYEILQRFMGPNVWVNSVIMNNFEDDGKGFEIYTDVKTDAEAQYIKSKDGVIIQVNNPNHVKGKSFNGGVKIKPDHIVTIKECTAQSLSLTMVTDLTNIAIELYNKHYGRN